MLKKRFQEQTVNFESLGAEHRALKKSSSEALFAMEQLENSLNIERKRCLEMESLIASKGNLEQQNHDLHEMLKDLEKERNLLDKELRKLIDNQFGNKRDEEFCLQIKELQNKLAENDKMRKDWNLERIELTNTITELKDVLKSTEMENREFRRQSFDLKRDLNKQKVIMDTGLSREDLEEARLLLKLKRENRLNMNPNMNQDDFDTIQQLRVQFSECVLELDKEKKLVQIYQESERRSAEEIKHLKAKLEQSQIAKDKLFAENQQQIQSKNAQIDSLLRKLRNHGILIENDCKIGANIKEGMNQVDIEILGALLNDITDFQLWPQKLCEEYLTTFCFFDFYDFGTETTPLGLGLKPKYVHSFM